MHCSDPESAYCVSGCSTIPSFTIEELRRAIDATKLGRVSDKQGISAEMFKAHCPQMQQLMLDAFNHVIQPNQQPPESWLEARISVIFKKGDASLPENYRPIAILALLYKLFSRMLCDRVRAQLESQQSGDQAAYRKGFSTQDHLLTLTLLLEASSEWNSEVWLGLIDFEKAFDTIEHEPLWKALAQQGVGPHYIDILKKLYRNQSATIVAGGESRRFSITRGVRQGDPISSLLFVAVMETIFRDLKQRWYNLNTKRAGAYYGVVIDIPAEPLTNLRFADDIVLAASSRRDISKMIADLEKHAANYGLKIHMGKTVILTNCHAKRPRTIRCGTADVNVLPRGGAVKYLGRMLSIEQPNQIEVANRTSAGWATFMRLKAVLCNQKLSLKDRFRLFESCVSPCVLYACGTWTLTTCSAARIRSTQRQMLRWMVGIGRQTEEPWVDYIRRSTHTSEDLARKNGIKDWLEVQSIRKWKLAGDTARQTDGRWSTRLLNWRPHFRCIPHRTVGRPCSRWGDSIAEVAGGSWTESAQDKGLWMALEFWHNRRAQGNL